MSGILWAILGAAVGILSVFLLRLRQRSVAGPVKAMPGRPQATARHQVAPKSPTGLNRKQTRRFHGVSVKPGLLACKAAEELAGQRFLPDEVPVMPLGTCDQDKCQCAYAHHGDRRDREDRRSAWGTFGGFTPSIPGSNRRAKSRERRSGQA